MRLTPEQRARLLVLAAEPPVQRALPLLGASTATAAGRAGGPAGDRPEEAHPPSEPERLARAGLSLVAQPTRLVAAAVDRVGAVQVWSEVWPGSDDDAERLLEASAAAGVRLVVPGDADWPAPLGDLARNTAGEPTGEDVAAGRHLGTPFGLWARGRHLPPARAVAVVGARAATSYGLHVASELGSGLAERAVSVVSGAAFGIDAAAHRGALVADGHTVAVLACGLDLAYPRGHEALIDRIAESGSVLSEQPLGTEVRRQTFLQRNRLIAALSAATVLVEAAHRSGARNTVVHAHRLGRLRMAVPGPVTSALSAGCHALLREGEEESDLERTLLVTSAADVTARMGSAADLAARRGGPRDPRDALSDAARGLLDAFPPRRVLTLDQAAAAARLDPTRAFGVLTALEVARLVESHDGGYRLTALGRQPTAR